MTDEQLLIQAWDAARPEAAVTEAAHRSALAAASKSRGPAPLLWLAQRRRRGLLATAFAALVLAGGAVAITRPLQDEPDRPVPVTSEPEISLPPSVAAAAVPGTVRLAATSDGYSFYLARGKAPGSTCLLMSRDSAEPDVVPTSCGDPGPGGLNVLVQSNADRSRVGAAAIPPGATKVLVNGQPAPVIRGIAPFTTRDARAITVTAVSSSGTPLKAVVPEVEYANSQP